MVKTSGEEIIERHDFIQNLIDTGKIDTTYRDLYVHRARFFLSEHLPLKEYHDLMDTRKWLMKFPNKISAAMDRRDWMVVKELSGQMGILQKLLERKRALLELGEQIYNINDVHIYPFSPGFNQPAGISIKELPALLKKVVRNLKELTEKDQANKNFYLARYAFFMALPLSDLKEDRPGIAFLNDVELQRQAQESLNKGDMESLEKVAEALMKRMGQEPKVLPIEGTNKLIDSGSSDRLITFSQETLSKAERLGLGYAHVDESKEYASLYQYALHPDFSEDPEKQAKAIEKLYRNFPQNVPDALKQQIKIYAIHSFVNSGGSPYFPDFRAEDFLVENFPESQGPNDVLDSELLSMLGLQKRRGLSRKQIERALFENGPLILRESLGLDPELFRLVCIPPDLYLRLGESRGWARQEIWTHFDGYKFLRNGRLNALAGGDIRFGGVYDLVSIGREYESERVITRLAVIQRKRMTAG